MYVVCMYSMIIKR